MMATFTVVTGLKAHEFIVHASGCADVARSLAREYPFGSKYDLEADTVDEAVALDVADYQSQGQGWTASDYHVLPCARKHRNRCATHTEYASMTPGQKAAYTKRMQKEAS